jgi:hypothetical protein
LAANSEAMTDEATSLTKIGSVMQRVAKMTLLLDD